MSAINVVLTGERRPGWTGGSCVISRTAFRAPLRSSAWAHTWVERLLGHQRSLAALGAVFGLALIVRWVLRRVSGLSWREALWPRREQPPPSMESVKALAQEGMKIQAVKMYRELTGADLKAGVEAVDAMRLN